MTPATRAGDTGRELLRRCAERPYCHGVISRTAALTALLVGGTVVLLGLAVTGTAADIFPAELAKHVSEDSEGWLLALVLAPWVRFVRPALPAGRRGWVPTLAVAAVCLVLGVLFKSGLGPPRVTTLNETLFALAVLLPWLRLPRPLPRWLAVAAPLAVLVAAVATYHVPLAVDLAEGVAMLVLVPIGLDLVDRGVLEPGHRTPPLLRAAWYAFLVLAPLGVSAAAGSVSGVAGDVLGYLVRVQEAFVGLVVAEVYLVLVAARPTPAVATVPAARAPHPSATAAAGPSAPRTPGASSTVGHGSA